MVMFAAGCGSDDDDDGGDGAEGNRDRGDSARRANPGLLGPTQDGLTDPDVDWVTDFEKTGCEVNVSSATPRTRWRADVDRP